MAQRIKQLLIFILTAGILFIFLAWCYAGQGLLKGLFSWLSGWLRH
jgi:hypothetical protein